VALEKAGTSTLTLTSENTYIGKTTVTAGTLALGNNGTTNANIADSRWLAIGSGATFDTTARTLSGANGGFTFDGKISGGGTDAAGTTFATVTNAAKINTGSGGLTVGDNLGAYGKVGTLAPGGTTTTPGDQIGHIYTSSNLTISGQLVGTLSTTVDRLSMQLNGATFNAVTLLGPTWNQSGGELITGALAYLNGGSGNLAGHDYINVGGQLTLNQYCLQPD
jgi:fibronectin-binding autotransporter adhesin